MRLRTLPAAVAPVILGVVMAVSAQRFDPIASLMAFLGALAIQIGTNFANDYFDYRNGADTQKRLGPTRMTQAGLVTPATMKRAMVVAFGIAALCGIYLVWIGGTAIAVIGILSILFGILYTGGPIPLGYIGLGEILVLIFFGPVATAGTLYVNTLTWDLSAIVFGFALGLMSTAIIIVNNLRDIAEDRVTGKTTLAARFGPRFAKWEYTICVLGACAISSAWSALHGRIWGSAAAAIVALAGARLIIRVWKSEGPSLNPLLGQTGRLLMALALGISVGWLVG